MILRYFELYLIDKSNETIRLFRFHLICLPHGRNKAMVSQYITCPIFIDLHSHNNCTGLMHKVQYLSQYKYVLSSKYHHYDT
jgi:hypothetical protein